MDKLNKNMVPNDYTLALALTDSLPVFFFLGFSIFLYLTTFNIVILLGGIIGFIGGLLKVIWKLIVVIRKKNIWPLFIQMRYTMPLGVLLVFVGILIHCINNSGSIFFVNYFFKNAFGMPEAIIFTIAIMFMVSMIISSKILGTASKKANWYEEIFNTLAQLFFLIGSIIIYFC